MKQSGRLDDSSSYFHIFHHITMALQHCCRCCLENIFLLYIREKKKRQNRKMKAAKHSLVYHKLRLMEMWEFIHSPRVWWWDDVSCRRMYPARVGLKMSAEENGNIKNNRRKEKWKISVLFFRDFSPPLACIFAFFFFFAKPTNTLYSSHRDAHT